MANIHGQTIALSMIVKDEAHVITRALDSVREIVDFYSICDTGSTDNTIEVVETYIKDNNLKGEVHRHDWVNFSHNRNLALDVCQGKCDYILQIDADEVYVNKEDGERTDDFAEAILEELYGDYINIETFLYHLRYQRQLMFKDGGGVRWEGPCHEYITFPNNPKAVGQTINSICNYARSEGGRSISKENKFLKDAALFEDCLKEDPTHARSWFYLGQSYENAHKNEEAIPAYKKAIELTKWSEEKYISYMRIAGCLSVLNTDFSYEIVEYYLKAYETNPYRLEALHDLIKYLRNNYKYKFAELFCDVALKIPRPTENYLFVVDPVYKWKILDEISMIFYYVGRYEESYELYLKLLDSSYLEDRDVERIRSNMEYTKQYLQTNKIIY